MRTTLTEHPGRIVASLGEVLSDIRRNWGCDWHRALYGTLRGEVPLFTKCVELRLSEKSLGGVLTVGMLAQHGKDRVSLPPFTSS